MSEVNLPEGWVEVQWSEITQSDGFRRGPFGGNLKKEFFIKKGFAVYEQYAPINDDCSQFRYFISEEKFSELSSFRVENGDFLISCSGTMGKITRVPIGAPAGVINQALLRIRLFEKYIDQNYFIKLFRSPEFQEKILTKSGGGAIQNLAAVSELKEILLPLAPLAEQQQIAQKLDELLAQVDTLKARLDAIPKILKRFRQSVLAAAVSGRLTEAWRESDLYEDGFPLVWQKKRLSEIGSLARGKSKHRPRNDARLFGSEYPFIQTGEVANCDGKIRSATKFYSKFGLQQSKLFPAGTLCITIAANIADTAILEIDACFPDSIVGFTPNTKACLVNFVKFLIDVNKDNLEAFAPATAQKNINLKILNEMQFPLPSLVEQTEIVRRVEQLFTYADQIEQRVKDAQTRVNHLTQSILAKAFRGELTADWRAQNPGLITGENSAAALLERIRAEREGNAKPKKKRA